MNTAMIPKPCCAACAATGGSCAAPAVRALPLGFGQDASATTTNSNTPTVAVDMVSAWAVPIAVGLVAAMAGFGLAYAISKR